MRTLFPNCRTVRYCFVLGSFPQRNNSGNYLLGACTAAGISISLMMTYFRYSESVFLNLDRVKELGWPKLCEHGMGKKCSVERAVLRILTRA